MVELRWSFYALLAWRKGKVETSPFFILPSFSTHSLSSRKAMKRSTTLSPLSKQRLHKSQFLQKLSCQKPHWDQARLSSLVNKQDFTRVFIRHLLALPLSAKKLFLAIVYQNYYIFFKYKTMYFFLK